MAAHDPTSATSASVRSASMISCAGLVPYWSSSGGVGRSRRCQNSAWGTVSFCKAMRKERRDMAKRAKANLGFLLVKAEVKGIPEKGLL